METAKRVFKQLLPVLLMIMVQCIFGGYSVFTSRAFKSASNLSPLVFAFCRDAAASMLLMGMAAFAEFRQPPEKRRLVPAREDLGIFVGLGLLGVWGSQGLSALAISNLSALNFSVLEPAMPVVTLALSLLLGVEKWNSKQWQSWGKAVGVLVTVGGAIWCALASAASGSNESKNPALGNLFLSLQVIMGGSYPVLQKLILGKYSSIMVAAWGYLLGTGLLLLSVITCAVDASSWEWSTTALGALAYAAIASSAIAYSLMAYVNKVSSPVLLTAFFPMQPVLAAVLTSTLFGETIVPGVLEGGGLIAVGLICVVGAKYTEGKVGGGSGSTGDDEKHLELAEELEAGYSGSVNTRLLLPAAESAGSSSGSYAIDSAARRRPL